MYVLIWLRPLFGMLRAPTPSSRRSAPGAKRLGHAALLQAAAEAVTAIVHVVFLCHRCAGLDDTVERLHDEAAEQQAVLIKLEAQLTAAAQRLGEKHRLMAEVRAILVTVFSRL